jgi:hypothetical protein
MRMRRRGLVLIAILGGERSRSSSNTKREGRSRNEWRRRRYEREEGRRRRRRRRRRREREGERESSCDKDSVHFLAEEHMPAPLLSLSLSLPNVSLQPNKPLSPHTVAIDTPFVTFTFTDKIAKAVKIVSALALPRFLLPE